MVGIFFLFHHPNWLCESCVSILPCNDELARAEKKGWLVLPDSPCTLLAVESPLWTMQCRLDRVDKWKRSMFGGSHLVTCTRCSPNGRLLAIGFANGWSRHSGFFFLRCMTCVLAVFVSVLASRKALLTTSNCGSLYIHRGCEDIQFSAQVRPL